MRLLPRPVGARLRAALSLRGARRRAGQRFVGARLRIGSDASSMRQGLVALMIASAGGFLAGITLGSFQKTLASLPGLLVLVPAAIGMRGNVFGALGSRLGTSIHTGTFAVTTRRDTVFGQNVLAAMALSMSTSLALAVLAKSVAVAFGLPNTISILDFVVISVAAGAMSSIVVLAITVAIAAGSVRYGWDMDNVAAPLVTAAGDVVTLPSLFLATFFIGVPIVTPVLGVVTTLLGVGALVGAWRTGLPLLRRILRESVPVLVVAGAIDVVAGLTIEKRLEHFIALPALLVLIPPFLEDSGALGSVLSSRLATKLHLGVIDPVAWPQRQARLDFLFIAVLMVPVFVVVGAASNLAAAVLHLASPGMGTMVLIALIAGGLTTVATVFLSYYGTIAAYRLGLDPDNHGIPLVSSSMDLLGALAVIFAIVLVGLG